MASEVKLLRFTPDFGGYKQLLGGSGVQGVLTDKANAIAARADGAMPANGYVSAKHHKVVDASGKFSPKVKRVITSTALAKYQQARHKTLTSSIGT